MIIKTNTMKNLLLALCLTAYSGLNAQITYESPYVKDGESFKFDLPEGYLPLAEDSKHPNALFSKDPDETMLSLGDGPPNDAFLVMHMEGEDTKDGALAYFKNEIIKDDATKVFEEPKLMNVNGVDIATAFLGVNATSFSIMKTYVGLTVFKDYLIMMMYMPADGESDSDSKLVFESMVNTFTVYKTTRENQLNFDYDFDDDMGYFSNSEFESNLSYEDVFFEGEDSSENWSEFEDDDAEKLLISYAFLKETEDSFVNEGMIKVFSAGDLSQYSSSESKADALRKVFPNHMISGLSATETYPVDELEMTKYNFIVGTKAQSRVESVYSTTFKNELIFIVVENTESSSAGFGASSKEFISTMWIWDQEEFDEFMEEEYEEED